MFGGDALARIRPRSEPEIDQPAALRRGEHEMRHLMQDHISLGIAVERGAVPVERRMRTRGMDRHAELAGNFDRLPAVPLGHPAACPLRRCRPDAGEGCLRPWIIELCRELVERRR